MRQRRGTTATALALMPGSVTQPPRRGRPRGSGLYSIGPLFLADLCAACDEVSAQERRMPTAIKAGEKMLDGISSYTIRRRLKECGYPSWADWLAHWRQNHTG